MIQNQEHNYKHLPSRSRSRKHKPETIEKMKATRNLPENKLKSILENLGDKNPMWKGDEVGYSSLHTWIKRRLPKPELCQICNAVKPYDLANITGDYTRELDNWRFLCRKCHTNLDYKNGVRILNVVKGRQGFQHRSQSQSQNGGSPT